ncbi:Putrescine ABC transporter putrescine-binding protein PotF (TC 3.A.1.11.2) [Klebsiella pneumoniae]|nr:Putrescine ABC transporter putrescine-binding protein PotF (TC 3.A.1.11.2) [Klebsiella pneumoniae]
MRRKRDMTAFGKKWLTGLVTGALMAVSAGSLAAEQKNPACL